MTIIVLKPLYLVKLLMKRGAFMLNNINDVTVLNNGVKMPWIGLGVWQVENGREVISSVKAALKAGYRSIDTAAAYGNEEGVGKALKESGIAREKLFITTKLANDNHGYENTRKAFEDSRRRLGLEYLDLYLIHWPGKDKYKETWRAFETLYKQGLIRAIGVSNFLIHHLENLMDGASVVPAVNQVEFHPMLVQKELRSFCRKHSIQLEAYSPLIHGNMDIPELVEIGKMHGKSPAQVILRWDLQNEVVTIPKSVHENRIIENKDVFNFELSADEIAKIDALNKNKRFGDDPDKLIF